MRNGHKGEDTENSLVHQHARNQKIGMAPRTETRIARNGRPSFVHRVKILGAWPLRARPYKSRDAPNKIAFPDEKALEKTQALMM